MAIQEEVRDPPILHDDLKANMLRRLIISAIAIWSSLAATFGSSIFSPAAVGVEREFHVGTEVGTLGTSLFVLGYAFGPVVSTCSF